MQRDVGHKTHPGADWFSLSMYMCFCVDTVTNTEELSALQVTSQERTEVDTAKKAEQLLPVLGDDEREAAVKQPSVIMPVLIPPHQ